MSNENCNVSKVATCVNLTANQAKVHTLKKRIMEFERKNGEYEKLPKNTNC